MDRWLITYATADAQTARIASHIARQLDSEFHAVRVCNVSALKPADLKDVQGVIFGSYLENERFPVSAQEFVKATLPILQRVPSGLFSVSLDAAAEDLGVRERALQVTQRFAWDHGWRPDQICALGGAVRLEQLGFFQRMKARRTINRLFGVPPEEVGEELTDWNAVYDFVRRLNPVGA